MLSLRSLTGAVSGRQSRTYFPTVARLPMWAKARLLKPSQLTMRNLQVRQIHPRFEVAGRIAPRFIDLDVTVNPFDHFKTVGEDAPIDREEIVSWMHGAVVNQALADSVVAEYNRAGSQLISTGGDPYIPGVIMEDIYYRSVPGQSVSDRRYGEVFAGPGKYNVPAGGNAPGIFKDYISWGAIPWVGISQWIGFLFKWKELASTPITQPVGFPIVINNWTSYIVSGPQFMVMAPSRPALYVSVQQKFRSTASQRVNLVYRDPDDYTKVLGADFIDLPEGESEVNFNMFSIPFVPPLVFHMQPEDKKQLTLASFTTQP